MPGSVADILFCWYHWLGKHSSNIWDLVPGCLLWTIWTEQNRRSFEDEEKTVVQLLEHLPANPLRLVSLLGLFGLFYPFGFSFLY